MIGGPEKQPQGGSCAPKHKSQSVPERADARTLRTRRSIDSAFVELLHGRVYESIRVSDVARKARVGRATFYAHFESKDALLRSQFDRMVAPMIRSRSGSSCPFDCTALFQHILSARRLYRSLAKSRAVRECFEQRMRVLLEQGHEPSRLPLPALAFLAASSLASFLEWSLASQAEATAAGMQGMWSAWVGGAFGGVRSGSEGNENVQKN